MEEPLTLSTWNVKGALSSPKRVQRVFDKLMESGADVITLPDAWHEDSDQSATIEGFPARELLASAGDFRRHGYTALRATFREDRPDDNYARYGFMTLISNTIAPVYEEIRLGERPAHHLRLELGDTALNIVSLYLNDQNEGNRLTQTYQLLRHLAPYEAEPTILMGDFNAMHSDTRISRLLRTEQMRKLFRAIHAKNDTLPRLSMMANGRILEFLEATNFTDADPHRHASMPSYLPLFQLDHFLLRDGTDAALATGPVTRTRAPHLSDHAQLTTTISINKK